MKKTIFPTLDETLYLHEMLIDKLGGSKGLRDKGLLESSLYRPQSGFYKTLAEQAAALIHSLTMNHCFIDGNKRVAFALTATFLLINGYSIEVSADDAELFVTEEIIKKKGDIKIIATWIEKHIKQLMK